MKPLRTVEWMIWSDLIRLLYLLRKLKVLSDDLTRTIETPAYYTTFKDFYERQEAIMVEKKRSQGQNSDI